MESSSHMIVLPRGEAGENAALVGVQTPENEACEVEDSLRELGELIRSAGGKAVLDVIQRLEKPTAPFYIGKGKAAEIGKKVKEKNIQVVVFDDELSPAQVRNLEKILECKVIDRTQLILDVFARRAKSREGKLQIELAQLQYLLPRLTRMWTHLSRQYGGIGTRGPGETQLEVDRRRVLERIGRLQREIKEVRKHRGVQREGRERFHWPVCALVGYTNAGKSTLMNRLTSADVYVADQLFATLDPTIRQFSLPNKQRVLVSDTVGFLRKLPHHLIEAFQATLEEVVEADLLIHVVDVAHPLFEEQILAVEDVLKQLHADGKQTLMVFNKIDVLNNDFVLKRYVERYSHSVGISALMGEGMDDFFALLENMLKTWLLRVKLRLPQSEGALLAEIHRIGHVLELKYDKNDVLLTANIPPQLQGKVEKYKF